MADHLIAERYAAALSGVIADNEQALSVMDRLDTFAELMAESHDLRSCLGNPSMDIAQRRQVLDDVLKKLGIDGPLHNLAQELLRRGRITLVGEIASSYSVLVDKRLNRVTAFVTTALPMTDGEMAALTKGLEHYSGMTVRLRCKTDPRIICGTVVRIAGKVIDDSVKSRLDNLRTALLAEAGL
jgi:F-type H+-transporting ATPase subunit delta